MKTLISFLLILPLFSWSQQITFNIDGYLDKEYSGNIKMITSKDTFVTTVENKHFNFKGKLPDVSYVWFKTDSLRCPSSPSLYIDSSNTKIEFNINFPNENHSCLTIKSIKGSYITDKMKELERALKNAGSDSANVIAGFIKKYPKLYNSYLSVINYGSLYGEKWAVDCISSLDESLEIKHHVELNYLVNSFSLRKIGSYLPDFKQATSNGDTFSLHTLKGKVVLLDFWATWCKSCREAIPELRNLYEKYHKSGFEIVSISLDRKKDIWLKGISSEKMDWINISEINGWKNSLVLMFDIKEIPQTFLLDKEGRLVSIKVEDLKIGKEIEQLLK